MGVQLGFLVFSAASLWALGRRAIEGRPSIDRPLTLVGPDRAAHNLVVPVGIGIGRTIVFAGKPMTLGIHSYRNVVRPDNAGADQVRFMVVMLFPKR